MKVEAVRTPTTARDLYDAARAWGLDDGPAVLWCGHVAVETGWMAECWCWNLGNVKSAGGDEPWCERPCGENVTLERARQLVAESPTLVRIEREYEKDGVQKAAIRLVPPHPWCRFRAYASLAAAVDEHLVFLRSRYAAAWGALLAADVDGYVEALKRGHYFTAELDGYKAAVRGCVPLVRSQISRLEVPMSSPVWLFPELAFLPARARIIRILRWAKGVSMSHRRDDLIRIVDGPGCEGPKSSAWTWFTNCCTAGAWGIIRCALATREACAKIPMLGGRTLADPHVIGMSFSDMMHAGSQLGIMRAWNGDVALLKPATGVRVQRVGNDDHWEWITDEDGIQGMLADETCGAGRWNNGFSCGPDDLSTGRPVRHFFDWASVIDRLSPARPVMSEDEQRVLEAAEAEISRLNALVAMRPPSPLENRPTLPPPEE